MGAGGRRGSGGHPDVLALLGLWHKTFDKAADRGMIQDDRPLNARAPVLLCLSCLPVLSCPVHCPLPAHSLSDRQF